MDILELEPPSFPLNFDLLPNIFRSTRRFITLPSSTKCNLQKPIYIYYLLYLEMFIRRKIKHQNDQLLPPILVLFCYQSSLYNLIKCLVPLIVTMCEDWREQSVTIRFSLYSLKAISFTWADLTPFMSNMFSLQHTVSLYSFSYWPNQLKWNKN
jgi:hypothetical protein